MTLHVQTEFSIPEETIRIARAVYPRGNILMKIRNELGVIYQDQTFASLFPHNGRPVEASWRSALVTVSFNFWKNCLTDKLAGIIEKASQATDRSDASVAGHSQARPR